MASDLDAIQRPDGASSKGVADPSKTPSKLTCLTIPDVPGRTMVPRRGLPSTRKLLISFGFIPKKPSVDRAETETMFIRV